MVTAIKPLSPSDPTAIASYRLLGVLGGGGMGRVYLGQSATGRRLAIKVIYAGLADDPVFRRRFAHEVAAARAVNPLFTAAVVDADPEAATPWLATTYIEGPNLEQFVRERGPLTPAAVLTLAAGLAEGLASIHRIGLVHRDLKPANVLLDDDGPHIIDFGVALDPKATRVTTSLMVGTPSYMSPERIHGEDASPAGDIFALGAILVYAATGKNLVSSGTVYEQIVQIVTRRFDLSAVPSQLRPLVVRCLSDQQKDRPTAAELARSLVASGVRPSEPGWYRRADFGEHDTPTQLEPPSTGEVPRRRVLAAGAAGALMLVVSGGVAAELLRGRPLSRRGAASTPNPGRIIWQLRSGAGSLPGLGGQPGRVPIVVDQGERVISVDGSQVFALDRKGRRIWARSLRSGAVSLKLWRDDVIVADSRTLWLLSAATGEPVFTTDVVEAEEAAGRGEDHGGRPVEIRCLTISGDRAFVDLATATIAIDRIGRRVWRRPHPVTAGASAPSRISQAADDNLLVSHEVVQSTAQVGVYEAATGTQRWVNRFSYPADAQRPAPRSPGPPPTDPRPPEPGGPHEQPGGRPGQDVAWRRSEAEISSAHLVLRDQQALQVLRAADGQPVWQTTSQNPVAAVATVADTVLVSADRLTAYTVATGTTAWQNPLRGAQLGVRPSAGSVVAATEDAVCAIDLANGHTRWQAPTPVQVRPGLPDQVIIIGQLAVVVFRPRDDRHDPLDLDVVAVALDN